MRIVIALGGNALLQREQPLTMANQQANVELAMSRIARVAAGNSLVITHGNGPQIGLLALQTAGVEGGEYPLDLLGALTDGMLGYLIEQSLGNVLPPASPVATLITQVLVDRDDRAFATPDKPVGPVYDRSQCERLEAQKHWAIARDGAGYRRVVPSPLPLDIVERRPIHWLLSQGCVVICAGGGGIPVIRGADGCLQGVAAVVDKDRCSALLAEQLSADLLIIATDVPSVYRDWGLVTQQAIGSITPDALEVLSFAAGSMAPKVQAACQFARTGKTAVIGAIADIDRLVSGQAGTRVSMVPWPS
jgi:carbamate kinase